MLLPYVNGYISHAGADTGFALGGRGGGGNAGQTATRARLPIRFNTCTCICKSVYDFDKYNCLTIRIIIFNTS